MAILASSLPLPVLFCGHSFNNLLSSNNLVNAVDDAAKVLYFLFYPLKIHVVAHNNDFDVLGILVYLVEAQVNAFHKVQLAQGLCHQEVAGLVGLQHVQHESSNPCHREMFLDEAI